MKTDELADEVRHYRALITSYGDGVALSVAAAVQLADERDAAIKQRDRALALLRPLLDEPASEHGTDFVDTVRALLAEVDG